MARLPCAVISSAKHVASRPGEGMAAVSGAQQCGAPRGSEDSGRANSDSCSDPSPCSAPGKRSPHSYRSAGTEETPPRLQPMKQRPSKTK